MILSRREHTHFSQTPKIPVLPIVSPPSDTRLFLNYYKPSHPQRAIEIDTCLYLNVSNPDIDKVFLLYDITLPLPESVLPYQSKIVKMDYTERMTFKDMLTIVKEHTTPTSVSIICNSDIILDDVDRIKMHLDKNMVFAITRYEITKPIKERPEISSANIPHSFGWDTWAVRGFFQLPLNELDIHFGTTGCDSKFNLLLHKNRYKVLNPYKYIKTYHYHLTGVRNYTGNGVKRCTEYIHYKPSIYFQIK
jgi:hypothetical protein